MGKTDSFKALLLNIAQELTSSNFEDMKFACDGEIPDGVLERLARPIDLFSELEHRDLLTETNKDFLVELLLHIGRQELARKLLGMNEKGLNFMSYCLFMQYHRISTFFIFCDTPCSTDLIIKHMRFS
jgi:hypothetical protein